LDHYAYIPEFHATEKDAFEDDPTLDSFNGEHKMHEFIDYIHTKVFPAHRSNHVALPWGDDFAYSNAHQDYSDMERLIRYINKNNKVNMKLIQSTPGEYIDALKKANVTWPP